MIDVVNGDGEPVELQGYDIRKCFDKMNYHETHNDIWDAGIKDDKFALLSKLDSKCEAVVKTPVGRIDNFTVEKLSCRAQFLAQ